MRYDSWLNSEFGGYALERRYNDTLRHITLYSAHTSGEWDYDHGGLYGSRDWVDGSTWYELESRRISGKHAVERRGVGNRYGWAYSYFPPETAEEMADVAWLETKAAQFARVQSFLKERRAAIVARVVAGIGGETRVREFGGNFQVFVSYPTIGELPDSEEDFYNYYVSEVVAPARTETVRTLYCSIVIEHREQNLVRYAPEERAEFFAAKRREEAAADEARFTALIALYAERKSEFAAAGMELTDRMMEEAGFITKRLERVVKIGDCSSVESAVQALEKALAAKQAAREQAQKEREIVAEVLAQVRPAVEIDGEKFFLQGRTLAVPPEAMRHIIGRGGERIKEMSAALGFRLQLKELQTNRSYRCKHVYTFLQ